MSKFLREGCALLLFVVLLGSCYGFGILSAPEKTKYEYVTVEKQVTGICPTATPFPTYTPIVRTLEGKECPVCPTPIPPKVEHYVPAFVENYWESTYTVDVYSNYKRDEYRSKRVGILDYRTPVNVHVIKQGSCFITFTAPWGSEGWVDCDCLTDK